MNNRSAFLFTILSALLFSASCSKESAKAADPKAAIKAFFESLDQEYMNPGNTEGPAYDKVTIIKKAVAREKHLAELASPGEDAMADHISALSSEEQAPTLLGALRAMAESLPFGSNSVISAQSNKLMNDSTRNAGIGLVIRREGKGKFFVIDSLEGSPSHRDNIPTGFFLQEIDGEEVSEMYDLEEVVGKIRGEA